MAENQQGGQPNPATYIGGLLLIVWIAYFLYYILQPPSVIQQDLYSTSTGTTSSKITSQSTNITYNIAKASQQSNYLTQQAIWSGIIYSTNCIEAQNLPLYSSKSSFEIKLENVSVNNQEKQNIQPQQSVQEIKTKVFELDNVQLEYSFLGKKDVKIDNKEGNILELNGVQGEVVVKVNGKEIYRGSSDATLRIPLGEIEIETTPPTLPFEVNKAYIKRVVVYKEEEKVIPQTNQSDQLYKNTRQTIIYYVPTMGKPYLYGDYCYVIINNQKYTTYGNKVPIDLRLGENIIYIISAKNCEIVFQREKNYLEFDVSRFGNVSITLNFQGEINLCLDSNCKTINYNIKNWTVYNVTKITLTPVRDSFLYQLKICKI